MYAEKAQCEEGAAQEETPGWARILSREGAEPKVLGHLFKAVVQAVLVFGAETWVLTPRPERALGRFQHRVKRWITGRQPRRRGEGSWDYPPLETVMAEAGLEDIGVCVTRRQNTVAQYIATRPILDLCEWSVRRPVAWVSQRWWD